MTPFLLPYRKHIASQTSVVQLEYPTTDESLKPLPKPGENWTRFVLISDTHTSTFDVPDGDVLIHAGDLTHMGTLKEFETTMEWLYALPHPVKIVIAGNHDHALDRKWYTDNWHRLHIQEEPEPAESIRELFKGRRAIDANIIYLEGEEYRFCVREGGKEWSVYGSPVTFLIPIRLRVMMLISAKCTPVSRGWAFGYKAADAEGISSRFVLLDKMVITQTALVSSFPKTDILLTHGPPHDVLDVINGARKKRGGCPALAARVPKLKPRLHVFGHIHEARGAYVHLWNTDAPPSAQNAVQFKDQDDNENLGMFPPNLEEPIADGDFREQTLFVNAANSPSGPESRRDGEKVKVGASPFQPIIVDLKE
ncbi:hypothetical protein MVEN_01375900 [Mycena venus]|uniref:Calcineurin-like phosphoesterase domain-containing protein n=1 Tax=Mycena venus TaxID=2733690 RepID=A0A8H7CV74_9AGAR|nr:hypothetical protein MVEN_01375900 [Mycena venus]